MSHNLQKFWILVSRTNTDNFHFKEQLDWCRNECRDSLDRLHDRLKQKTKEWEDDYWIFKNVSVSYEKELKDMRQDLAALRKKMERLNGESEPKLKEELAAPLQEKKESAIDEKEQELSTVRLEMVAIRQELAILREEKKTNGRSKKFRLRRIIPKGWWNCLSRSWGYVQEVLVWL